MKTFTKHISEMNEDSDLYAVESLFESYDSIMEALITFGGKAYPSAGHVVILAGGAGSGKGFVKDKLLGIEGKVFDVDELKMMAAKSPKIVSRVKKDVGVDLETLASDMKDPDNVGKMHDIIADVLNLPNRKQSAFYASVLTAPSDRKPNIIFDSTLKDLNKLSNITRQVLALGYKKENIHIVWTVNDIEVAKAQNTMRPRQVPVEILIGTHRGASQTMLDIIKMGNGLTKYMDGAIVLAFNKVGVDTELLGSGKGGSYIVDANYVYIKQPGKTVTPINKISKDIRAKISSYVPKNLDWI